MKNSLLENSKSIGFIKNLFKDCKYLISISCEKSIVTMAIFSIQKNLRSATLKTIGFVTIVAVIINTFCSMMTGNMKSLIDWIVRGLILLIGFFCLSSNTSWATLKDASRFIRFFKR